MRIRQRWKTLVALLLCLVMLISMIGVQPIDVSADATGSVGESLDFSSNVSTDVTTYFGVRFLLLPYNANHYAWRGSKDIKKMSKGKVDMDADIKKSSKIGATNNSNRAIYIGVSSGSKVAVPTKGKVGTTGGDAESNKVVRSYG